MLIPTLTQIDSSAKFKVGQRYTSDDKGDIYKYLQGIASIVAGDWVSYIVISTTGSTTARLVANAKGGVAIALAAIVAGKFGWFQVAGMVLVANAISAGDAAALAPLYSTATPGLVDDVFVDGDMIFNAHCAVQEGETPNSNGALVANIDYPHVNDLDIVS